MTMAAGSNNNPYKEGGGMRTGRQPQGGPDSNSKVSMGTLSAIDLNRMTNHHQVETNRQPSSWSALNKSILPPPKKRHHHVTAAPHPVQQQPSRVIHMECKENKGDRGGSLTSRISTLSPGTKRKMLGYAADGSIPPLPPRQKRIKRVSKQGKGDSKLSTKYTRLVEPSGLLGDLKPGIMREQMRTRRHIHALLGAVVGEVPQKDYYLSSIPAIDSSSCETDTSEFPVHLEEQPQHHNLNHEYTSPQTQETTENLKDETINPGLHPEVCDTTPERLCGLLQSEADSHDEHVDVLMDMRKHTGLLDVKTNDNRASGFVRFQRGGGLHTCNSQQHSPIPPSEPLKNNWTEIPAVQRLHVPLLVDLKQEPDFASTSGRESCLDELIHCKQEDMEEDDSKYAFDFSSACGDVASPFRHVDDAVLLQPQDSRFLVSVAAANVATCWLELLSLDVKGRLAALKRSKRRVNSVILSGELDLDVPLLPCTFGGGISTSCALPAINQADGVPQVDSWRRVFESMDRALALEGDKLESWLQQIHVMQVECRRDMTMSTSAGPPSFSEPMPRRPKDVQQALPASTDTFASPIGDALRT